MADRSHLSIGEVLSLLRDEFPDVTISKIRFLESQGLVDPERTPSGYRKFYDHDVERLRWILRQQRENFLPLKVIRGRLSEQERADAPEPPVHAATPVGGAEPGPTPAPQKPPVQPPAPLAVPPGPGAQVAASRAPEAPGREPRVAPPGPPAAGSPIANRPAAPERPPVAPVPSLFAGLHGEPAGAEATAAGPAGPPRRSGSGGGNASGADRPAPPATGSGPAPAPSSRRPAATGPAATGPAAGSSPGGGRSDEETYTAEELAHAAGADVALVGDLTQYGLISPHAVVGGTPYYDGSALAIASAAVSFSQYGVEVRHLKVWRNAAEREADLFQQVVLPLLRQRNPQARQQALDTLAKLTAAGAELRAALVERAVRDIR